MFRGISSRKVVSSISYFRLTDGMWLSVKVVQNGQQSTSCKAEVQVREESKMRRSLGTNECKIVLKREFTKIQTSSNEYIIINENLIFLTTF